MTTKYSKDIEGVKISKDMLDLARHIVETKSGHFKPQKFEDHYEDALKDLIAKRVKGEKIEAPKERPTGKVINLMDALRRSVKAEGGSSARPLAPPAILAPPAKKPARRSRDRRKCCCRSPARRPRGEETHAKPHRTAADIAGRRAELFHNFGGCRRLWPYEVNRCHSPGAPKARTRNPEALRFENFLQHL